MRYASLILIVAVLSLSGCSKSDDEDSGKSQGSTTLLLAVTVYPPPIGSVGSRLVLADANVGTAYTVDITASGGVAPYQWLSPGGLPPGMNINGTSPTTQFFGIPTTAGQFDFTLEFRDSTFALFSQDFRITINPAAPVFNIDVGGLPTAYRSLPYSAVIQCTGGSAPFTWRLQGGTLPSGLALGPSTTNAVSLTGTVGAAASTSNVMIEVEDSTGAYAWRGFLIDVRTGLRIEDTVVPRATEGAAYSFQVSAGGGTGTGYTWTVASGSLPPGISLVSGTPLASLSGTPTAPGTYTFDLRVQDSLSSNDQVSYTMVVAAASSPLQIAPGTGTVMLNWSPSEYREIQISASGGSGTGYQWSIAYGGIGSGLVFDAVGTPFTTLRGQPTTDNQTSFVLRVTDSLGATATQHFAITSVLPSPNIQVPFPLTGNAGTPFSRDFIGQGGVAPYVVRLGSLSLAPGLAATPIANGLRLSGIPTAAGNYETVMFVWDGGGGRVSRNFTIFIGPVPSLSIPTTSLPDGEDGTAYSQTITGQGGTQSGYTWSIVSGALPPGLTLAASGTPSTTLAGTPTQIGQYSFVVEVQDSGAGVATQGFSMDIVPPGGAPGILTTTLSSGTVAAAYSQTITGTGGTGNYGWSVISGTLPPGLTLGSAGTPSTTLSGTPTQQGSFPFTVQLQDQGSQTATQAYTVIVSSHSISIVPEFFPDAIAGISYSKSVVAEGGSGAGYQWDVPLGTLPPGLGIGAAGTPSTTMSGTPSAPGVYRFTLRVRDSAGDWYFREYRIAVLPSSSTLQVLNSEARVWNSWGAILELLQASGGTPPYTWDAPSGLPTGLELIQNSPTATLKGGLGVTGQVANVSIRVTDSLSAQATRSIAVYWPGTVLFPDEQVLTFTQGVASSVPPVGVSGGVGTVTWTQIGGQLPPGMSFSQQGNSGLFSGTPATAGGYRALFRITDSLGMGDLFAFALSVIPPSGPDFTRNPGGASSAGFPISIDFTAQVAQPIYNWSLVGTLPKGLALSAISPSSGATVSGTPPCGGQYVFQIKMTDTTTSQSVTRAFLATFHRNRFLITTATALPQGTWQSSYNQALQVSGGTTAESKWGLYSGTAPTNLNLAPTGSPNGLLSGTLSGLAGFGNFSFEVVVLDADSAFSIKQFTLQISGGPNLRFFQQPTNTVAGTPITPAVQVELVDSVGARVTAFTGQISLALDTNPSASTLSGTLTQSAVAGVATFGGISLNNAGGLHTLRASSTGFTDRVSDQFQSMFSGVQPSLLRFAVQPTNLTAGQAISPALEVEAVDGNGQRATSFNGNITVGFEFNAGGAILSGTLTQTASAGVATFTGLSLNRVGVGYTLKATASGLATGYSDDFDVQADVAAELRFLTPGTHEVSGVPFPYSVRVEVTDTLGNRVMSASHSITLDLPFAPTGMTLSGTLTQSAVNGLAVFPGLMLTSTAPQSGVSMRGVAAGLASGNSIGGYEVQLTASYSSAVYLRYLREPENGVAGQPLQDIVLHLVDNNGYRRVENATNAVTLNISQAPSGPGPTAVLSGTRTVNAVNGIVTFSGLSLNKAGAYTLVTSCPTLPGGFTGQNPVSRSFVITPLAAAIMNVHTQPQAGAPAQPIAPVIFEVVDSLGNRVTTHSGNVSAALHFRNGNAALSGGGAIPFKGGLAAFSTLSLDQPGLYSLRAEPFGLAWRSTSQFAIVGPAASLIFTTSPGNALPAQNLPGGAQVRVRDLWGTTVVTPVSVSISLIVNPGGGSLTGTTIANTSSGTASLSPIQVSQPGVGYVLEASATGVISAFSAAFTVFGPTARIELQSVYRPGYAINQNFSVAVKLVAADGTLMTNATNQVSVALGANPGGSSLTGTLTRSPVNGIATFSDLQLNQIASGYTLVFSSSGITGFTTAAFAMAAPGVAFYVDLLTSPTSGFAGEQFLSFTARVRDINLATVTSWATPISLSLTANPTGASLTGTTTLMPVNGNALFTDIAISAPGTGYRIGCSSGSLIAGASGLINIAPAAVAVVFQDVLPNVEQSFNFGVALRLVDLGGNFVSKSGVPLTLSLFSNPGGLSFTPIVLNTNSIGAASFTVNLANAAAAYRFSATSPGLTTSLSNPFDIVAPNTLARIDLAGIGATQIAGVDFTSFTATLRDGRNQILTSASNAVTISLLVNPSAATLSGTLTKSAVNGVATFTGISVNLPGVGYVMQAGVAGLTDTQGFQVVAAPPTPGTPTQVLFTASPTSVGVNSAFSVSVRLADSSGLTATASSPISITLAIGANPGGAAIAGELTMDVTTTRQFTWVTLSQPGVGYTLTATGSGLTSGTSNVFDVYTSGTPAKLLFLSGPPGVAAVGQAFALPLRVQVSDGLGNRITGATQLVSLAFGQNPSAASLGGTASVNAVDGIATFPGVSISAAGLGYTLVASASGLVGATSTNINIGNVGVPAKLDFVNTTQTSPAQVPFSPSISVRVVDVYDALCAGATPLITLTIETGPTSAALTGVSSVAAAAGIANFSLTPNLAGLWRLRADATGLGFDISPNLTVTQAAASIAFIVQPGTSAAGSPISPSPQIEIRDGLGQRLTSATMAITLSLAINPTATSLAGTIVLNASAGVATFSSAQLDVPGVGYVLRASMAGVPDTTSNAFQVATGSPYKLGVVVQPQNGTAGQDSSLIEIRAQDSVGNDVANVDGIVSLALGNNPTGAMLEGVYSLRMVNGRAYFNRVKVDRAGTGYTLVASHPTLIAATTNPFNMSSPAAAMLVFGSVPADALPNSVIAPFTVEIRDRMGRVDATSSATITISIGTNPGGGALSGTLAVGASAGVATFNTLSINQLGAGYTLVATASGLASASSGAFDISAAPGPRVHEMSPRLVREGLEVVLSGTGFSTTPALNNVSFGGISGTVQSAGVTELVVVAPAAVAAGNLTVTVGGSVSNAVSYSVGPIRVNLDSSGQQTVGTVSRSRVSADGRYVAFNSNASNLVAGDTNGVEDVFLRDTQSGTTTRVSVSTAGAQATDGCQLADMTPDGRYVLFYSSSINLDTNPHLGSGMMLGYVYDRIASTTTLVTLPNNVGGTYSMSAFPVTLSGDARFIAFYSDSTITPGDTNGKTDGFLLDRQSGTVELLHLALPGQQVNDNIQMTAATPDMRYFLCWTQASNVLPGDTNGQADLFLYDRISQTTRLVSASSTGGFGNQAAGIQSSVSPDGRYVAFTSVASDLVAGDTNGLFDVFVRDMVAGVTVRASVHTSGAQSTGFSVDPWLSPDGQFVVFSSDASNIVNGDTNAARDVFVRDLVASTTKRISVTASGAQANALCWMSSVSANGMYAVTMSDATNLVSGDTNASADLFVLPVPMLQTVPPVACSISSRYVFSGDSVVISGFGFDPTAGRNRVTFNGIAGVVTASTSSSLSVTVPTSATTGPVVVMSGDRQAARFYLTLGPMLATVSSRGESGSTHKDVLATNHDGRYLVFTANESVVFDDTNGFTDVFVHDRETAVTERVSIGVGFIQGNGYSNEPDISGDGRFVVMTSAASNLISGDTNGALDVFVYDRWARSIQRLPNGTTPQPNSSCSQPDISLDGGWVTFSTSASNLLAGDTNGLTDIYLVQISSGALFRASLPSSGEANNICTEPSVSDNGEFVVFESTATNLVSGDTNNQRDVFLYTRASTAITRVSVATGGTQGNATSGYPVISADGAVIAFNSESSNFVTGDTNNRSDIFTHIRTTGITECISVTAGGAVGDMESGVPQISADGRMVLFVSLASNLVTGDTNNRYDVFVRDRQTSVTRRISRDSTGAELTQNSEGFLSADGATAYLETDAALGPNDTNVYRDGYGVSTGR